MALTDPIMSREQIDALNQRLQHRKEAILAGFALYQERELTSGECTHALQPGTRAMRIERLVYGWRVWLATRDFIHGTYLELHNDGAILNCTVRADEGDDRFIARPSDNEIRNMQR